VPTVDLIRKAKENNPRNKALKIENIRYYLHEVGKKQYHETLATRGNEDSTRSLITAESMDSGSRFNTDQTINTSK
jgi:hypothetical protein